MNAFNETPFALTSGVRPMVGLLSPSNYQLPLPPHKLYVETRGSSDAWLFHKNRSKIEVLNDSDGEAMNLSRALVQRREQSMLAAAFARMDLRLAAEPQLCRALRFAASIEKASRPFAASAKARAQLSPISMASGLTRLDHAFDRLRGVQIEDGSTCKLIRRYDWEQAFFLCDERNRLWNNDDADELLGTLADATGSVMLIVQGEFEFLTQNRNWRRLPLPPDLKESVWINF